MTIYHMINWFFAFSFMGYLLECVVLTYEYKTPVLNRGFCHGPFCIIYGFGALGACFILQPLAAHMMPLYLASSVMATVMELITAHMMIWLFGSFWWDYSHKKFNYKGMICLESSIGWGFLGIFFFYFLNDFVHGMVARVPENYEKRMALGLLIAYLCDFAYSTYVQIHKSDDDDDHTILGRLKVS